LDSGVFRRAFLLLDGYVRSMYISLLSVSFSFCVGSSRCKFFFLCLGIILKYYENSWSYSSTLAYLVDANNGRSSTSVALNSAFRGSFAFVATEITVPLQVCTQHYGVIKYSHTNLLISRRLQAMVCILPRLERKITTNS
jgi:hypothetical protein